MYIYIFFWVVPSMFLWFLDLLSVAQRPYGRASEPSTFRTEGTTFRCEASIAEGTGDFGMGESWSSWVFVVVVLTTASRS